MTTNGNNGAAEYNALTNEAPHAHFWNKNHKPARNRTERVPQSQNHCRFHCSCTSQPSIQTNKQNPTQQTKTQATAEQLRKARASAAVRLQAFAVNRARRHQLNKRFAARKAKLDFERRNRAELASACLVMFEPRQAIRDAAGREDFEAMGDAVRPAVAVARLRASAAARGLSLSEMSAAGVGSDAAGGDDGACVRPPSSKVCFGVSGTRGKGGRGEGRGFGGEWA